MTGVYCVLTVCVYQRDGGVVLLVVACLTPPLCEVPILHGLYAEYVDLDPGTEDIRSMPTERLVARETSLAGTEFGQLIDAAAGCADVAMAPLKHDSRLETVCWFHGTRQFDRLVQMGAESVRCQLQ